MTRRIFIPSVLLGVCLLTILWQRNAIGDARRSQSELLAAKELAARLADENDELAKAHASAAGTDRTSANNELLRLRNEVRQLRALPQELARLQADNERLAAAATRGPAAGDLTAMEGYQARESWNDAGLSSPEATLQTFFRAVRDQDMARLMQCLSEQGVYALGLTGPSAAETMKMLGSVQGYRIESRNEVKADRVALNIRAKSGGTVLTLTLRRTGEEWKIDRN